MQFYGFKLARHVQQRLIAPEAKELLETEDLEDRELINILKH